MAKRVLSEPEYVTRLSEGLRNGLPGCEIEYERVSADRYRYRVIWDTFNEMDHADRQHLVWAIADRLLEGDEIFKVTMISTLTQDELSYV